MNKTYFELLEENINLMKKITQLEHNIIEIEGWKGKDNINIEKKGENWVIIEHRKNKETGQITKNKHIISRNSVRVIWKIIKELCPHVNDKTKYREIVSKLIDYYKWENFDLDSFNGGRNRSKKFFPYYYYPIKVLEKYKFIDYSGVGIITLIKKNNEG